jgi:vacuolar-type H+-ATPase subunit B/Vma2
MENLQTQAQMAMAESAALSEEVEARKGYEGYLQEEIEKRG